LASVSAGFGRRHFEIICSEKSPELINTLSASVPTMETRPPFQPKRFPNVGLWVSASREGSTCEGTGAGAGAGEAAAGTGCGATLTCEGAGP
jgi:hypothetical protein